MILISAGDSVVAKLVKEAGFDGVWVSGFEACARLGIQDNGSITLDQMSFIVEPVVRATELPVYVDVDTGYKNFKNTVKRMTDLGVAGVCIEDVKPHCKQNSLWGDKCELEDAQKFADKIGIPRKIEVIARTEAYIRGYGEYETWRRLNTYKKAGANWLFPHSRTLPLSVPTMDDCWTIAPTKFPQYTNSVLNMLGYTMIIWANQTERVKIRAVRDMLFKLKIFDRMLEAEQHLCATLEDMKGFTK